MNNRISLQDLAGLLATETGQTKKASEEFLREFINVVSDGVFTDSVAKVKGLGTFKIIKVEDRESVNVNTGNRFIIPGHYKFNFTPDKDLKELVNKPFSFFDTTEINDEANFRELVAITEEKVETDEEKEEREEITETKPEASLIAAVATELSHVLQQDSMEDENKDHPEKNELPQPEPTAIPEEVVEEYKVEIPADISQVKDYTPIKKNKTPYIIAGICLFIVIGISMTYLFLIPKRTIGIIPPAEITTPIQPHTEEQPTTAEPEVVKKEEPEPTPAPVEEKQTAETLAHVTIEPGSRLTLLALDYYGSKIFWVYIYEYNKAIIKDPNNIPVGTKLGIPAPSLYDIDAKNKESIERASLLQTQIIAGEK